MDEPIPSSFISTSPLGTALNRILSADEIVIGSQPSYQLCKDIYIYHPLGAKMAEAPVSLAQSQDREISVPNAPEEAVEAFLKEWEDLEASRYIFNTNVQARIYGLTSLVIGTVGADQSQPVDLKDLWKQKIYFNVFDPLNTSGLIVDQDPNSPTFQKHGDIVCQGTRYHRSRTLTVQNEESLYIAWSDAAFSFSGRSVYLRALYPLKSFLNSMRTDDLVLRKAGVFIAKQKAPGTIVDRVMQTLWGIKRAILKQSEIDNVISIGIEEDVSTLNMQNVQVYDIARNNVIKNIATADNMPAKLLTQEAFVEGFGEGTEDAKAVAQYADRFRIKMAPIYRWFDVICMYRAWNEEWYETIRERHPEEYGDVPYSVAFYAWKNAFKATWPSLLKEPPSELVQVDDVKLKAAIALVQVLSPLLDPVNGARLIQTIYDNLNSHELLFEGANFELD